MSLKGSFNVANNGTSKTAGSLAAQALKDRPSTMLGVDPNPSDVQR